jgi:hypothetical protein
VVEVGEDILMELVKLVDQVVVVLLIVVQVEQVIHPLHLYLKVIMEELAQHTTQVVVEVVAEAVVLL